jgi:hypothetical protein
MSQVVEKSGFCIIESASAWCRIALEYAGVSVPYEFHPAKNCWGDLGCPIACSQTEAALSPAADTSPKQQPLKFRG